MKIEEILKQVQDEKIRGLIEYVINKHFTLFTTSPAACTNHHNYIGGLLDHSYSTAMLAGKISDHFLSLGKEVKRDVVVTGAFLHDIGKVWCYKKLKQPKQEAGKPDRLYESTKESKLFHHIPIGFHIVASAAESLGLKADDFYDILHIILSHHGRKEYSSPVTPRTVEAFIVHKADFLDAYIEATPEMRNTYNE